MQHNPPGSPLCGFHPPHSSRSAMALEAEARVEKVEEQPQTEHQVSCRSSPSSLPKSCHYSAYTTAAEIPSKEVTSQLLSTLLGTGRFVLETTSAMERLQVCQSQSSGQNSASPSPKDHRSREHLHSPLTPPRSPQGILEVSVFTGTTQAPGPCSDQVDNTARRLREGTS